MPAPVSVSFTTVLFTISGSLFVLQVLSAATIVAKHTSALCNACRLASSKTSNPVARRQFVQSAKEVANTTANLVKTIKVNSPSDQNVECEFVLFLDQRKVGSAWRIRACKRLTRALVSGLGCRFFRGEPKQVPCCHDATPGGCWKPVHLCQQPRVCKHPSADQQWGVHQFPCQLQPQICTSCTQSLNKHDHFNQHRKLHTVKN